MSEDTVKGGADEELGVPLAPGVEGYVGDDEAGQEIRNYGLKNPKAPIIVKHNKTGHMMYLRHPTPKYVEW